MERWEVGVEWQEGRAKRLRTLIQTHTWELAGQTEGALLSSCIGRWDCPQKTCVAREGSRQAKGHM